MDNIMEDDDLQELIDWADQLQSSLIIKIDGGPNVFITNQVSDPTNCPPPSPDKGDVWMDWDGINNQFNVKVWDGTGWEDLDLSMFDDLSSDPDDDFSITDLTKPSEPTETPEQAYDRAMGVLK